MADPTVCSEYQHFTIDVSFNSHYRSIGATVVEMLTANPPFSDLQPETVILEVGNGRLTPPISQNFSREARALLQKCFKRYLLWEFGNTYKHYCNVQNQHPWALPVFIVYLVYCAKDEKGTLCSIVLKKLSS